MDQQIPGIGLAFLAGLLSFISPCVLPLVPAYVSYLSARVTQQVAGEMTVAVGVAALPIKRVDGGYRLAVLLHGLMFVLGLMFVFVVFGVTVQIGLKLIGIRFYDLQRYLAQIGGVIVIFFGLHVMGVFGWLIRFTLKHVSSDNAIAKILEKIQAVLYADTRRQVNPRNPYGYMGSAFMGAAFAAGWAPCTGPIYGAILSVALPQSVAKGAWLLTVYSMGIGLPFLITAVALEPMRGLIRRLQRHMRAIEIISGVFLIGMGYLLATNQLAEISGKLSGLADFSYNLEQCVEGVVQQTVPAGDFGQCMQLGIDYKYRQPNATSLLIGGDVVHVAL